MARAFLKSVNSKLGDTLIELMLIRATNFIKVRRSSQKLQKISDCHLQSPGARRNVALRYFDVASQDPPKPFQRNHHQ